jgi:hypothetical protein
MRNSLITFGVAGAIFIGGVALDPQFEIVPWQYSQSVPAFDTPSQALEIGQYSVTDTGQVFFNVDGTMRLYDPVSEDYRMPDILKLQEVRFIGERHEDVFAGGIKEEVTKADYEALKTSEREPIKTRLRLAGITEGAITVTGTSSVHSSFSNSVTFALNCTGATDPGVMVFLSNRTLGNVTGVTYNGDALTNEVEALNSGVAGHEIWSRTAADLGNNNVVISNSGFQLHTAYATCLSGTDQTDIVEATTSVATGFGSSITGSVTSLTDGAWLMTGINLQNNNTLTPDSPEIELYDEDNPDGSLGRTGVSYLEKATAGSETMGWTFSGDNHAMVLAVVKPSVALPTTNTAQSTLQGGMQVSGGVIIK